MKRKIDDFFKKELNIPQNPPADAWEYIQKHISKKDNKRILPFWLRASGIAALFLAITGTVYLFNPQWLQSGNSTSQNRVISIKDKNLSNSEAGIIIKSNLNPELVRDSQNPENRENRILQEINPRQKNSLQSTYYTSITTESGQERISQVPEVTLFDSNENDFFHAVQDAVDLALIMPDWDSGFFHSGLQDENLIIKEGIAERALIAKNEPDDSKSKPQKKKIDFDRFYISGFASPMALNTFVGSSMLADEMRQYKTENNITLAYGVKGAYALSPRFKIRTGASIIGFEQITKDVPLSSNIQGASSLSVNDNINNIKYEGNLRIDNSLAGSFTNNELNNKTGIGDVQQQSKYIEIPVEAEVSLFQTHSIGISATGGGSTWLLSRNKIYVHTDEYTEELGEASNLNSVSFSANAGLKFDLNLSEKVKLNIEPNFKYLINPVNDIEKYNPYTVGVNAGISVSLK